MNSIEERLNEQYRAMNARAEALTDRQLEQLKIYFENLTEWNKVMNLTTITEEEDVYVKHFLDSLSLVCCESIPLDQIKTVIDVGTGAGFPGMVLAIAHPEWKVTLLDSLNKRITFLEDTAAKLGLSNVTAIHARAEEGARRKDLREGFDLAVARAVANLATLSEYCIPFVRIGGYFASYKSGTAEEEIMEAENAVKKLGGKIEEKKFFTLGSTEFERCIAVIRKEKSTPKQYPRKAGTPGKDPLR